VGQLTVLALASTVTRYAAVGHTGQSIQAVRSSKFEISECLVAAEWRYQVRLWRQDRAQPLRYYLYISDSKLDMLFEQIDQGVLKRISAEVKVDLKLASVTLRQTDNPAPVRTAKLRVVERFIEQRHHVGTVQEPGREYFRGQLDMEWGWLEGEKGSSVVFFMGRESSQFVALAGSRRHVLGENIGEGENVSAYSVMPNIAAVIDEHIPSRPKVGDPQVALNNFADLYRLTAATQPLEFLAVPLVEGQMRRWDFPSVHGVLGTPLYVAAARP
jgi:hypothetical protein